VAVQYQIAGRTSAAISESIEAGVRDGELAAGAQLPPVRDLAGQLGVAAGTVAAAYQALRQRGVIETAGRNGTRVRSRPPVADTRRERRLPVPPGAVDLSAGEPDPRLLPDPWPRLRELAGTGLDAVGYRGAGVLPELADEARQRLAADGVTASAITVTAGALDGIDRLLAAHARPGDRVGVEDPGWANMLDLVAAQGLTPVPLPVDDDGPTVDGLRRALRLGLSALVVTARAQNPTGAAVGAARAAALRETLAGSDTLVIEDDHAAELAHEPPHPLAGATARWAFLRSVSKPYGPDLRLAVLAGDEATVARVQGRLEVGAGWVSTILQRLVLGLWRDPGVARLVDDARQTYARRRSGLLAALAARGIPAHGRTGINVWVQVRDETLVVTRLHAAGWAVAPGSLYRIATGPGIRVTTATLTGQHTDAFADALARALGGGHRAPGHPM
jgi:DNA-binding transcriptional MocR family regulator